jgi:CubicO group peptidase (beta-lactamase class C family)
VQHSSAYVTDEFARGLQHAWAYETHESLQVHMNLVIKTKTKYTQKKVVALSAITRRLHVHHWISRALRASTISKCRASDGVGVSPSRAGQGRAFALSLHGWTRSTIGSMRRDCTRQMSSCLDGKSKPLWRWSKVPTALPGSRLSMARSDQRRTKFTVSSSTR